MLKGVMTCVKFNGYPGLRRVAQQGVCTRLSEGGTEGHGSRNPCVEGALRGSARIGHGEGPYRETQATESVAVIEFGRERPAISRSCGPTVK